MTDLEKDLDILLGKVAAMKIALEIIEEGIINLSHQTRQAHTGRIGLF